MLQIKTNSADRRRNRNLAAWLATLVVVMVALAYASVPLYDLFCRVTGYGGTTQRAESVSETIVDREFVVRFDSNISGLAWSFRPEQRDLRLKAGELGRIDYLAKNKSALASAGTATFNVTPAAAGAYFNKIECFCFTSQRLRHGEQIKMGVQFFIDPAIDDDRELDAVRAITLSYTFLADTESGQPVAHSVQDEDGKKL